jgi:hypothetical protein
LTVAGPIEEGIEMPEEFLRVLGMWALMHELADEAWKAAVERGSGSPGDADAGPIDSLAVLVAAEKDRLRAALESGEMTSASETEGVELADIRFELGELRGRLESIETTLDTISRRLDT